MFDFTARTSLLLGEASMDKLYHSTVAVLGIGGVGGACAEAIVRSGIGRLIIMDHDTIDITNINRQLFATHDTIGQSKILVAKKRLTSINPDLKIEVLSEFYNDETKELLFDLKPDFIVDAIDTVTSKLNLAVECKNRNIPLISSMGTGNRLDPTKFTLGTIEETSGCGCGLARVMRHELKARGITGLPVVYSTEYPMSVISSTANGRHSPASISFCPPVAGFIIASYVIKRIIE
ncbi:MAG: tRNA threonylcarbamoyladenosine dehydratase [Oscillospiraceae bacterium]